MPETKKIGELELNKIYCMDCLVGLKLLPDNSVDYSFTSPPYNQKRSISHSSNLYENYADNMPNEEYYNFLCGVINELLRVTKNQIFFNIQYNSNNRKAVFLIIGRYAENIKDVLIWIKTFPQPAICRNVLTHNYEFIIVFSKENKNRSYIADFGLKGKYTTAFIEKNNCIFNKDCFNHESHFAIMSINLARRIVSTFTQEGDIILDPFMGSGTTAVACKQLGRHFIGFEISQKYVDIANKRLEQENLKNWFGENAKNKN